MIKPEAFARKPFVIEAIRVDAKNMAEVAKWCSGFVNRDDQKRRYIKVQVRKAAHDRQTMAYDGDWVLRAGTGFRVYTDAAFHKSFERTDLPVSTDAYQTGNVFDLPDVDRKVVVEDPVGDEKAVQPDSVETVVAPSTGYGELVEVTRSDGVKVFRTPAELREAHRTGSSGYIRSDGSPLHPEDLDPTFRESPEND